MYTMVSNPQPILHPDEFLRSDRGPVSAEIIQFLSASFSSFQPLHPRAPSRSPNTQRAFTVEPEASLGLVYVFAWVWDTCAFDLRRELIYHRHHGGVGHSVLGEREGQEATRELIRGVYEYASAHRTFDVFVPSPTGPMESREEMFDHANRTEGVATVRVGYRHRVRYYLQTQSTREVFLEEAKRIAWLSLIYVTLYTPSDVVKVSLICVESGQVFLNLLQRLSQSHEFRFLVERCRRVG